MNSEEGDQSRNISKTQANMSRTIMDASNLSAANIKKDQDIIDLGDINYQMSKGMLNLRVAVE